MLIRLSCALLVIALFPCVARAEGLLYQLPDDGHWLRFELDGKGGETNGTETTLVGTLTMSSVGTSEVDGQKCRWIEIVLEAKRNGEQFTSIDKLLVPEQHLAKAEEPLKHVLKLWHKHSMVGDAPQQIEDLAERGAIYLQVLRPWLHGPFERSEKLEPTLVDSKLGSLQCEGITANESIEQVGKVTLDSKYSIRLHPKAPFGVVSWESETTVRRNGQALGTMRTKLKASDSGTEAKSLIPDAK